MEHANGKKPRTLLINTPVRTDLVASTPPIGIGYVAAYLREKGYPVEVLDIDAFRYSEKEVMKKIKEKEADVFGIGGIVTSYKYTKWLVGAIKNIKPKSIVVIGGHLGSSIPHLLFKKTKVDFVVYGDGELTIVDLYENLDHPENVQGIYYRKDNRMVKNPPREPIKDIDSLPYPAYDLLPIEKYMSAVKQIGSRKISRGLTLLTHRGCPFRCIFCHGGKAVRMRKPREIIKEIKFIKERYGASNISFHAETFVVDRKWVLELCRLIKKERLGITWNCLGRVNLVDEALFKEMKSAGCIAVGYGIESASQKMLDAMKKDCTVEQQRKALLLTKRMGFQTYPTFMVGTPGETEETVKESVDFCKELDLMPEFFFMTPFPDTELYDYAMKKKLIEDEDRYIENLGECSEFRINLTDMPDETLINLKKKAEREVYIAFIKKHPIKTIQKAFKVYRNCGLQYLISIIKKRAGIILKSEANANS